MATDWLLKVGSIDKAGEPQRVHDAQYLLAGNNVFRHRWYSGAIDGKFGELSGLAAKRCKYDLGYPESAVAETYGAVLRGYLLGLEKLPADYQQRALARRVKFVWPTHPQGELIGFPGQGTHSYSWLPNNWESDNAWDIGVPFGSLIVAVADGVIGSEFGPLPDPDPRFHGIRLHLRTADNEFYYAHLSSTPAGLGPGVHIHQGQLLGRSGQANGVNHLHLGMAALAGSPYGTPAGMVAVHGISDFHWTV